MSGTPIESSAMVRMSATVDRPNHYIITMLGRDPISGAKIPVEVECKDIMEACGLKADYDLGTAFAYLWRCMTKHATPVEDVAKARTHLTFYLARNICDSLNSD